jgi:hypothetical protein
MDENTLVDGEGDGPHWNRVPNFERTGDLGSGLFNARGVGDFCGIVVRVGVTRMAASSLPTCKGGRRVGFWTGTASSKLSLSEVWLYTDSSPDWLSLSSKSASGYGSGAAAV